MSFASKLFRSKPAHVGDVRAAKTSLWKAPASMGPRWQALESSDEEEEPTVTRTLAELIAGDPILVAMLAGRSWADVLEGPCAPCATGAAKFTAAEIQAEREAVAAAAAAEEASIWYQSFSRNLEAHCGGRFDLGGLTEPEYEACMTWLYANGWHTAGCRSNLEAYPADLPPRVWVAPAVDRFVGLMEEPAPAAVIVSRPKKAAATVPRFCRASSGGVPCADATCRYVHADTMARLDKPCGFGAACGGTDPAKRAACLYMHPGETWDATLVVTRPCPCPCA